MGARAISLAEELKGMLAHQFAVTDWLTVDQERVDGFAKVTGDHQWTTSTRSAPRRAGAAAPSPVGSSPWCSPCVSVRSSTSRTSGPGARPRPDRDVTIEIEGEDAPPACLSDSYLSPPDQRNHAMTNHEVLPEEAKPTVQEPEHAQGWMSLAGALGGHTRGRQAAPGLRRGLRMRRHHPRESALEMVFATVRAGDHGHSGPAGGTVASLA